MKTIVLSNTVTARVVNRVQADNALLDNWHRLGHLAMCMTGSNGHAPMRVGQIGRELGLSVAQVSAALTIARDRGLLDPTSNARCLVLVGCGNNECEESHREPV